MKTITYVLSAALALGICGNAPAQQYPTKSVRMIVGFAPGGGTDIVGRIICAKLTEIYGQGFIVDNRAGATGTIGADIMAKAAPDGYTIMIAANTLVILPSQSAKPPYDPVKDFTPIVKVAAIPLVLAVTPSLKINSVKELIAYAKANPGKLSYGSSGPGPA